MGLRRKGSRLVHPGGTESRSRGEKAKNKWVLFEPLIPGGIQKSGPGYFELLSPAEIRGHGSSVCPCIFPVAFPSDSLNNACHGKAFTRKGAGKICSASGVLKFYWRQFSPCCSVRPRVRNRHRKSPHSRKCNGIPVRLPGSSGTSRKSKSPKATASRVNRERKRFWNSPTIYPAVTNWAR